MAVSAQCTLTDCDIGQASGPQRAVSSSVWGSQKLHTHFPFHGARPNSQPRAVQGAAVLPRSCRAAGTPASGHSVVGHGESLPVPEQDRWATCSRAPGARCRRWCSHARLRWFSGHCWQKGADVSCQSAGLALRGHACLCLLYSLALLLGTAVAVGLWVVCHGYSLALSLTLESPLSLGHALCSETPCV